MSEHILVPAGTNVLIFAIHGKGKDSCGHL